MERSTAKKANMCKESESFGWSFVMLLVEVPTLRLEIYGNTKYNIHVVCSLDLKIE
jgi:hypothetical protein